MAVLLCANAQAADWSQPAAELASRIAQAGVANAVLTVKNASTLNNAAVTEVRSSLQSALMARGITLGNIGVPLQITLSENAQGYLWIAEIAQTGREPRVEMISVPIPAGSGPRASVIIRRTLLWSQAEPMLDAQITSDGSRLIVLDGKQVAIYHQQGQWWQPESAMKISHTRPWPRDLRGRLAMRADGSFDAYLPGALCVASSGGALVFGPHDNKPGVVVSLPPIGINCQDSDDPWPLENGQSSSRKAFFGGTRDFFNGVLIPAIGTRNTIDAFYSAAPVSATMWEVSSAAGSAKLVDSSAEYPLAAPLGADVASLHSACSSGMQLLASGTGDFNSPDVIRAYEMATNDVVVVSDPIELPGPVTALWTSANGDSAVAITNNLHTKNYEAYRLAIACAQ